MGRWDNPQAGKVRSCVRARTHVWQRETELSELALVMITFLTCLTLLSISIWLLNSDYVLFYLCALIESLFLG